MLDPTVYIRFIKSDGSHAEIVESYNAPVVPNAPTQISVAKVDYSGSYVPGATLELLDAAGNVVEQWETTDAPHTVYGLPIGGVYTLHEAAAPEGWLLAEDVTFTVLSTEVQTITMEDERVPELHTTATVDGGHEAQAIGPVTLTDTVAYRHLIPGRVYTVTGTVMLKSTGKPLTDAEGQPITSSVTFTPSAADGEVEVVCTFDAKLLGGESVVVFEEISREGRTFATHADLEDEGQTVRFKPAIGTVTLSDPVIFHGAQTGDAGIAMALVLLALSVLGLLALIFWKRKGAAALLLALALLAPVSVMAEDTVTRSYPFTAATQEHLSYAAPETVEQDGKTYRLTDVRYEVQTHREPVTVRRTVQTKHREDYPQQITEMVDGRSYRLTAQAPEWTERERRTLLREYGSAEDVPQTLEAEGETYRLTGVTEGSRTEPFTAPAVFRTPNPASGLYTVGGTVVSVTEQPMWEGWQETIAQVLGLNGSSYTLAEGRWDGDFTATEGGYLRLATYTGTRQTPVWTAAYQSEPEYTAEITYVDTQYPEGVYEVAAIATYQPESSGRATLETVLKVGAGVLVLALVILGIGTMIGGAQSKTEFKETMKYILIGCAICFGASSLGKMFFDWFS